MSTIENAINAAKAKAAEATTVNEATQGGAVTVMPSAGVPTRMSAASFLQTAKVSVDAYLKVSEYGLSIGVDKDLVPDFEAIINLAEVQYCQQIRFGNPVQYFKTYDGARCADGSGRTWTEALALAKRSDPSKKSDPFVTADLVIHPVADVRGNKTQKVMAEAGQSIGHTPSYTGAGEWTKLLKAVEAAQGSPETSRVRVKISYEGKTNKAGQSWGVVIFELLGFVAD